MKNFTETDIDALKRNVCHQRKYSQVKKKHIYNHKINKKTGEGKNFHVLLMAVNKLIFVNFLAHS